MATRSKANGSVNLLGEAMKRVITEAVEDGVEPDARDAQDAAGGIRDTTATKSIDHQGGSEQ